MNYICFEQDALVLFNTHRMDKLLCFKYSPFAVQQIDNTRLRSPDLNFHALLGVKVLDDVPFLIVAEEAEACCNIGASSIFQIKKIDWVPIVRKQQLEGVLDKKEEKIKDMSKLFDEGHHYYSDLYRLNTTYYFNIMNEETQDQRKFYSQFVFNESLMAPTEAINISSWCKPIIQGYIQQFSANLAFANNLTYTIISRRSNRKQGTRYFARGIDDKGNVANFTETEQIISYGKFMISHLQIRGSVPAFFEQLGISGLSGELNITRNEATTQKAFQAHFTKLGSAYQKIFCVNLLSIKKPEEEKLTLFYENLISSFSPPYVRYQYFDFHEECKNNQFQNSERLIHKIKRIVDSFGATVFDTKSKKLISRQTGVIRTNCLDCLDRTNYMQSRISLCQFQRIIMSFSTPEVKDEIAKLQTFVNKQEHSSEVLRKFNSAWADNGDKISLHYTGIGSTHTDITKTGKRTIKGTVNHKMRSLMRFFVQFTDAKKNEAIQTMVNNPLVRSSSHQIEAPVGEFVNICLLSFEIRKQQKGSNLKSCLQFSEQYVDKKRPAGVVVFVYKKEEKSLLKWFKNGKTSESVVNFVDEQTKVIRKLGYQVVKKIMGENTCMLIFGNQIVVQNVTEIKNETVSNNRGDTLTICKLTIYCSSMVFSGVNCTSFNNFIELLQKSHDVAFQSDRLGQAKSSSILTHSYRTVLGNTASGSKISKQSMQDLKKQIECLRQKNDHKGKNRLISEILDNDELGNSIQQGYKYLKNYLEGPSYFAVEENRIIFWNKEYLITKVLDYNHSASRSCTYAHFSYELY